MMMMWSVTVEVASWTWMVRYFDLPAEPEMKFVEEAIEDDPQNNSAWVYRHFLVLRLLDAAAARRGEGVGEGVGETSPTATLRREDVGETTVETPEEKEKKSSSSSGGFKGKTLSSSVAAIGRWSTKSCSEEAVAAAADCRCSADDEADDGRGGRSSQRRMSAESPSSAAAAPNIATTRSSVALREIRYAIGRLRLSPSTMEGVTSYIRSVLDDVMTSAARQAFLHDGVLGRGEGAEIFASLRRLCFADATTAMTWTTSSKQAEPPRVVGLSNEVAASFREDVAEVGEKRGSEFPSSGAALSRPVASLFATLLADGGDVLQASKLFEALARSDPIRKSYWRWRSREILKPWLQRSTSSSSSARFASSPPSSGPS